MRDRKSAIRALDRAEQAKTEIDRTVWLAKAIDYAIKRDAVLVGGAAVNLHTASYRPTDVDMCAYLDSEDRDELVALGFQITQGDHFVYVFGDGERWPVEFPESTVDGDEMSVRLDVGEFLRVISIESLVMDRLRQATDGSRVTFDEAVRLCRAVRDTADWAVIEAQVDDENRRMPLLGLRETYERVLAATG